MTKARVLPEPVAASTATSLKLQSKGMVAAWTGVQKSKPECDRAWRTGSESGGFRSEKRTLVNALLGNSESMVAPPFNVFVAFMQFPSFVVPVPSLWVGLFHGLMKKKIKITTKKIKKQLSFTSKPLN